jgi:hypothetical protein
LAAKPSSAKQFVFAVLITVLFFGLLELACRVFLNIPIPTADEEPKYTVDADLFWHLAPNQCVVQGGSGIEYVIHLTPEGNRSAAREIGETLMKLGYVQGTSQADPEALLGR